MVHCLFFHIFVLNTIVCRALLKLRLYKTLYSKTFLNSEICSRFSSNQFVVAFFGCAICVCALKRLEFWLRNLQLRFKLVRLWLRNLRLHFKLKIFWLQNLRLHFTMCILNAQLCLEACKSSKMPSPRLENCTIF